MTLKSACFRAFSSDSRNSGATLESVTTNALLAGVKVRRCFPASLTSCGAMVTLYAWPERFTATVRTGRIVTQMRGARALDNSSNTVDVAVMLMTKAVGVAQSQETDR